MRSTFSSTCRCRTMTKSSERFLNSDRQYKVFDSWFTNQLSDKPYQNTPPDAQYLFVDVQMQNDDKEQRTVPEFRSEIQGFRLVVYKSIERQTLSEHSPGCAVPFRRRADAER